jgi:DNA-binding LacI/PurR family transcriptional regulator
VALAAGVSVATVSNALSGSRPVGAETAARVIAEAERLNYRVNRAARSLRTSRTDTIAICLSNNFEGGLDLSSEYLMQIVRSATDTAFAAGQRVLLSPQLRSYSDAAALGVDGALVMDPIRRDPQLDFFASAGVPVVTIEPDPGRPEHIWHVNCDNHALIRTLLDHVAAKGATRIAMVDRIKEVRDIPWAEEITGGYAAWCEAAGLTPQLVQIPGLEPFSDDAHDAIRALLSSPSRPDAVVTTFDFDGVTAVRVADELGLSVPADLQVGVALDDALAKTFRPGLTAMDLMPVEQAETAIKLLLARINGQPAEQPPFVVAELRERGSTR